MVKLVKISKTEKTIEIQPLREVQKPEAKGPPGPGRHNHFSDTGGALDGGVLILHVDFKEAYCRPVEFNEMIMSPCRI